MTRHDGFTLLEMLVALVVFGLLLAGLNQAIHYGFGAWRSQVRTDDRFADLDAVDRVIRHLVADSDPGNDIDPAPFAATAGRLEFVTQLPDGGGLLPRRRVDAALFVDAAHRLVLRWRPWLHAELLRAAAAPTDTILLTGVGRLELAYWQPPSGWITAWHANDLPALVRLRLIFPAGDARHWPDIVAAPEFDRQ